MSGPGDGKMSMFAASRPVQLATPGACRRFSADRLVLFAAVFLHPDPFVVAAGLAYFLDPAVTRLDNIGIRRPLGTFIILATAVLVFVAFVLLLYPVIESPGDQFRHQPAGLYQNRADRFRQNRHRTRTPPRPRRHEPEVKRHRRQPGRRHCRLRRHRRQQHHRQRFCRRQRSDFAGDHADRNLLFPARLAGDHPPCRYLAAASL